MVKRMLQGTIKLGEPTGLSSVSKCLSKAILGRKLLAFCFQMMGSPVAYMNQEAHPCPCLEVGRTPVPGSLTVQWSVG